MHNERVTITLPAELLEEARTAVRHGAAASVSVYIAEAVTARQLRERSLAVLASLYGGPPPSDELDEARAALRPAPPMATFG